VFPVRYELNLYILFRRNPVFKGLTRITRSGTEQDTWYKMSVGGIIF
jgi:hypothetical protein